MSIQTEINRLVQAKSDLIAQIEAKGVTVPADASLDDLAALVQAITGGEDLTEVLDDQDELIAQILTALEGKAAGGGDSGEEIAGLLMNTLTVLDNSVATSLRSRACQGSTKLVTVNLPNVTSMGTYAFYSCTGLVTVIMPSVASVPSQCFYSCSKLQKADMGQAASLAAQSFHGAYALTALILRRTSAICTLGNATAVSGSGIGEGTGYVYVPAALVDTYKADSKWSAFAAQIRAIEDYPEICGG